jgi:isoquinoline 1-oxidoreductase subunit beta
VTLEPASEYRLIGTEVPRLDVPDKLSGRATFGIDVRLPGTLVTTVVRCPVFGGRVRRFDAAKALALPGVRRELETSSRWPMPSSPPRGSASVGCLSASTGRPPAS